MTTTRKPNATHCIDCGRKLTSSNNARNIGGIDFADMCTPCYDYAGWENTHSDEGHDEVGPDADCPVCQGNVPTAPAAKAGHTNGIAKTNTSHAGHDHPATKAARAACRKARNA